MFRRIAFLATGIFLLNGPVAVAQETTEIQNVASPSVGISEWISIVRIPAVAGAPFTATTMMDNIQPLPDGTTVTTKTMTTIARDSTGRTHNENRYYLRPSDNGQGRVRDVTIYDPNARTRITLTPATQIAAVVVLPAPKERSAMRVVPREQQREDLGFTQIAGLTVHGYRQFRTIPEGQDGNDRAITITDEYWYSDQLRMNITLKHTDPRHGTQVVTLTQLRLEEPDPKMFEIPAEYTVQN